MSSTPPARSEALDGLLGDLRRLDDQALIDALEDASEALDGLPMPNRRRCWSC